MNYLSDTHILLWILFSPKKISKPIRNILLDPDATKFISLITFWEISLKFSLGKIDLQGVSPDDLPALAKKTGFELLNMDSETVASFYRLPKLAHKDPFDRLLAWQALKMDCILLTKDKSIADYKDYGLKVVW